MTTTDIGRDLDELRGFLEVDEESMDWIYGDYPWISDRGMMLRTRIALADFDLPMSFQSENYLDHMHGTVPIRQVDRVPMLGDQSSTGEQAIIARLYQAEDQTGCVIQQRYAANVEKVWGTDLDWFMVAISTGVRVYVKNKSGDMVAVIMVIAVRSPNRDIAGWLNADAISTLRSAAQTLRSVTAVKKPDKP